MENTIKKTQICLTLTGATLQEDAALVRKYAQYIDIAELRVDYLNEDEQLSARRFPAMIPIPCILTIRRGEDGGKFDGSEFSRTTLFGRALAFADHNPAKNFAYVDFEEYFHVPSMEDAALAFGVKIIRSFHDFENPVSNIRERLKKLRKTAFEIPKIAFMPKTLSDVTKAFKEAAEITDFNHIVCAMGALGFPSRILAEKLNSYLTYTTPLEKAEHTAHIGHIDPKTLCEMYRFRRLSDETGICAVTGYPLKASSSPQIHNEGYKLHNMDRIFIPLVSTSLQESLDFANTVGLDGMAVTIPYKGDAIAGADEVDTAVSDIGACNTLVRLMDKKWLGLNTDASGFERALLEFLEVKKLRRRRAAIIGAGGAAHAVAYSVKKLGGRACIFNRSLPRAKLLADRFGFDYAVLSSENLDLLERYSDIIIQTTNVGMNSDGVSTKETNPLWFYKFKGGEYLFDLVYVPEETPVMSAARAAGCKVTNGYAMLKYQAYRQFKYFTGVDYESSDAD